MMHRRDVITLLSGAAAAWPMAARAQQPNSMRRLGVFMNLSEADPEGQVRVAVLRQALENLGWTVGANLAIDYSWGISDDERTRVAVADLVRSAPDVILANGGPSIPPLLQRTQTIPIVFTLVSEPVALGFVASLARPGGNVTGFTNLEPTVGSKWLELLKETASRITRVAVMFNPETSTIGAQIFELTKPAAQRFAMELVEAQVRQPSDIEATTAALAREQRGGLIVAPDSFTQYHRKLVLDLAVRRELPAIYPYRYYADEGGLMSYGVDTHYQYRQAAEYIDRILRGAKPADLPVMQPTKFELVINLKSAKAIGLTVPPSLIAIADEVIE
jgi:putative ABC transport system substrate-binding protein